MDIARTVSPFIKGKSNLSCQPHFLHFFRENFPCGFAVENFHEKKMRRQSKFDLRNDYRGKLRPT